MKISNHITSVLLTLSAAVFMSGCQSDTLVSSNAGYDCVMKFSPLVSQTAPETKSMLYNVQDETVTLASEDGTVNLSMISNGIDGRYQPYSIGNIEVPVTKGDLINRTDDDIKFPIDEKSFWVSAWTGSSKDFDYEEVKEKTDVNGDEYWITVFPTGDTNAGKDKEHIWKKDETKTFYAYANLPVSGATVSSEIVSEKPVQKLTYTIPTAASSQTDILLGSYNGKGDKGVATIKFQHPLTAVGFVIGDIGEEKIKSIELSGLHKTGSVQMSDTGTGTIGDWTSSDYEGVSSQTTDDENGLPKTSLGTNDLLGTWFLLIPQEISSEHKVKVTVTFVSGTTASAFIESGSWTKGKTVLYNIIGTPEVGISFSDKVVYDDAGWPTKQNLEIKNTKTAKCFIRVSLVGDWVNKNHKIVTGWSETDPCGKFNGGTNGVPLSDNSYWKKGTDGFWYYKYYLSPGQTLKNPLFTTYTITTLPSIESIWYLDLSVNVQAVEADETLTSAKAAWKEDIVNAVGITFEEDK